MARSIRSLFGRILATVALVALVAAGTAQARVGGDPGGPRSHPDRVIVKLKEGAHASALASRAPSARLRKSLRTQNLVVVERRSKAQSLKAVIGELEASGLVEYVGPDYEMHASLVPNDPYFPSLWGLTRIDAPRAWDSQTGAPSVVVGVIDTGVDYTHPDLASNMWRNLLEVANGLDDDGNGYVDDLHGINCITGSGNPMDDHGHGTHVSGTIGGVGNDGVGVVGVNWRVQVMALKFLDAGGSGYTSDAIECLAYARAMSERGENVRLTSNSWGCFGCGVDPALYNEIDLAGDAGMLFVAAAGNSASDTDVIVNSPSSYDLPEILSVGASSGADTRASFSNWGATSVDLFAPGEAILSSLPGGQYGSWSGTSMATPHVSGVAASLFERFPGASPLDVKQLIMDSVDAVPALAGLCVAGGRLNLANTACTPGQVRVSVVPVDGFEAVIGRPLAVTASLRDCMTPITGANVAVAFDTGEPILALRDDGASPDAVANDGTYTAHWTPANAGPTCLDVTASFTGGSAQALVCGSVIEIPDYAVSAIPFAWVDATRGSVLPLFGDDTSTTIPIGFDFPFYGSSKTTVTVSSNGFLTFGTDGAAYYFNQPIPGASAPNDLVAPYWDDLHPGTGGTVYALLEGVAPSRTLTVQWHQVAYYAAAGRTTFQVTLFEGSGKIEFRYLDVQNADPFAARGASATVGIESADGRYGTSYSFDSPAVYDGLALEFRPGPDFDRDDVRDRYDNCPTVPNTDQADDDGDGVGQACDTCIDKPNPPFAGATTNRTLVSGQLDDDADGRGNACDFDYDNAGAGIGSPDVSLFLAALEPVAKSVGASTCGRLGNLPCGIHDHDGLGAGIGAADTALLVQHLLPGSNNQNAAPLRKCAACRAPFSRAIAAPQGATVGKPVCQDATGAGSRQLCTFAN
jgi:hypothetical protein